MQKIREYRAAASTPMELRTASIVMTGLGLGLCASDIVNLKLQDIDWKNRWIKITQAKTGTDLKLPLPNETGNSLYRYIHFGRPVIDSEFVFIHHKAPYGKLTTKICNSALYKILPERCDVHHKGFHVTRRTFATNILRKGAGISAVMDSLGHTDSTSVMKYLSFDEERMRQCTLTLKECGIELEGGLK